MMQKRQVATVKEENLSITLRFGGERLQLTGVSKLHTMQHVWNEKRHSNAQWELHFLLQGSCRVELEEGSRQMRSGQAILIAPGQYHSAGDNAGSFERFTLIFSPAEGTLLRQLTEKCPGSILLEPSGYMLQLAGRILREQTTRRDFRKTAMEAMLSCFLVELFRLLELSETEQTESGSESSRVTGVIDTYFEQHFADPAGEGALAEQLHISRRQLVRLLQSHYGMNFREKLIRTRMDHAAWLLRSTQLPVSRICSRVGYGAESAFFKAFRQQFGMTPNRYRREKQIHMR